MSAQVLIQVLGGFRLTVGGRAVTSLPRKAQALLAYLAMQDGRPVTRESVMDLLWTDRGVKQAQGSLREELRKLRKEMPGAIGPGGLAFVPGMVETDVGRFRLLARGTDRADLAEAAQTYEGALLDRYPPVAGDFDDWLRVERKALNDQAIEVTHRLVDACLAAGDVHPAVLAAKRMVALDLLREDSHRKLMEVYLRAGRRADAIRQYEACVEVLRRELDVEPSAETILMGREAQQGSDFLPAIDIAHPLRGRRVMSTRQDGGPPCVAVLPLRSLEIGAVDNYLGVGLVDDIVLMLSRLRDPVVMSSNSSQLFRELHPDIHDIGNRLGVQYIVSGSIRHADDRFRILVELSETSGGTVLWAHAYDIKGKVVFDAQDHIATHVVNTIVPQIRESELRRIRMTPPSSLSAYDLTLQARELVMRLDRESFARAGTLLGQALAIDPDYATALAALADWHSLRIGQGWSLDVVKDTQELEDSVQAALENDPNHARALAIYGHNRSFLHKDYQSALSAFDDALDRAPNDANVWKWSATTFAYLDDGQETVRRAERALTLSPRDPFIYGFYSSLCVGHYATGEYEAAVHWGRLSHRANPMYTSNARYLCAALVAVGALDEAREVARMVKTAQPVTDVRAFVNRHPFRNLVKRQEIAERLTKAGLFDAP